MKKNEIILVIAGTLGLVFAIAQIASSQKGDPMRLAYSAVFAASFGLLYLGLKDYSG